MKKPIEIRRKFIVNSAHLFSDISSIPRNFFGRVFTAPIDKMNPSVIGLGKQCNMLSNKFLSNTGAQIETENAYAKFEMLNTTTGSYLLGFQRT